MGIIKSFIRKFNSFFEDRLPYKRVGRYYKRVEGVYRLPDYIRGRKVDSWNSVGSRLDLYKPIFYDRKIHSWGGNTYFKGCKLGDDLFDDLMQDPKEVSQYNRAVKMHNKLARKHNRRIRHKNRVIRKKVFRRFRRR